MGGTSLEQAWKNWLQENRHKELKALPPIVFWGIWLARNSTTFQEKDTAPEITTAQSLSIISHFPQNPTRTGQKTHTPEQIDFTKSWAYFDGASQNNICGGGFTLHLSNSHFFHTKLGLGQGTNNHVKTVNLKTSTCLRKRKRPTTHSDFWRLTNCGELGKKNSEMSQHFSPPHSGGHLSSFRKF
jgi:hypothetical protein